MMRSRLSGIRADATAISRTPSAGASLVEFAIVAPVLLGLGLGTVQAGLVYHGKTILNYATFEAARTGALNHARQGPMLSELGNRLAPLKGGDGTAGKAASALLASRLETVAQHGVFTHVEVLNPTLEAFEQLKVRSREADVDVIPNSHLRHQSAAIDPVAGVSLRDANLLKIRVTHGFDLAVPGVARLLSAVMTRLDPVHAHYYAQGKLPLSAVATVRMHSEVHGDDLRSAQAPAASERHDPEPVALAGSDSSGSTVPVSATDPGQGGVPTSASGNSGNQGECFGSDPLLPTAQHGSCDVATVHSSPVEAGGDVCS